MNLVDPDTQLARAEELAKMCGRFPLRDAQRKALEKCFQGRNLLLIWPTGSGKSLCYQLPSQILPGVTLVLSPLIALMEDQVRKAPELGLKGVACLHSGLSRELREKRQRQLAEGQLKLLYVTPERFRRDEFRAALEKGGPVSLLAIDEAHCMSQWGHDFRPDYARLGDIRKSLGSPRTMALTATATAEVQRDIAQSLQLPATETDILWEGVERSNLYLAVEEVADFDDKFRSVQSWLKAHDGPKILYFTLINTLQKVSAKLAGLGVAHDVYHGDLDARTRRRNQEAFLRSDDGLMLATPAFGLGIDKPNVRGVLHFELPGSLEAYYQEIGRGGRDGAPAFGLLLYAQDDLLTQMNFIESLTPEPTYVRAVYDLLVRWQDRLKSLRLDDLREQLSFKNKRDYRLETVLNLLDRWEVIDWSHKRLDRLEMLRPLSEDDVSESIWKARKLQLQKKLHAVVEWVRSPECRKIFIYRYFGWTAPTAMQPCGFCDRCKPL